MVQFYTPFGEVGVSSTLNQAPLKEKIQLDNLIQFYKYPKRFFLNAICWIKANNYYI